MNFDIYTTKSKEAIQSAQQLMTQNHNPQLEQIHLLVALLQQENGLVPQLLKKMDVTVESLQAAAEAELQKLRLFARKMSRPPVRRRCPCFR